MQEETNKPGSETNETQQMMHVVDPIPDVNEINPEQIGDANPSEIPPNPDNVLPEGKKIMMMPPPWRILNGSGKICLQMVRRGEKMTESGLFLPAEREIIATEKYKSPIPSDAMFFVVDYDQDINYNYRKEKLRVLELNEKEPHKLIKMADKKVPTEGVIYALDKSGDLDVLHKGDEVHFNTENFMPVKIRTEWDTYYVIHFLDILGITKTFPRERLEG